jgi:hypothetical protein
MWHQADSDNALVDLVKDVTTTMIIIALLIMVHLVSVKEVAMPMIAITLHTVAHPVLVK